MTAPLRDYLDAIEPEPEAVAECAACLAPLTEDDPEPTCDGGDRCCLSCEVENEAAEIVLAEVRPHWTPSRSITERRRALETMREALKRAAKRIDEDEAKARAAQSVSLVRWNGSAS